jgi:G patch domain/KOW motif-containing protein
MKGFQLKGTKRKHVSILSSRKEKTTSVEFIVSIEGTDIKGLEINNKSALVIPLPPPVDYSKNQIKIEVEKTQTVALSSTTNLIASSRITNIDDQAAAELKNGLNDSSDNQDKCRELVITAESKSGLSTNKKAAPILMANLNPEVIALEDEGERFKKDVSLRAADMDVKSDKYQDVPILEFGAALLRGMGWTGPSKEEEDRDKLNNPVLLRREGRLGLGAMAKPPEEKWQKDKKPHLEKEWKRKADEKVKNQIIYEGDVVWLRDPKYAGKVAKVMSTRGVPGLDRIRVMLEMDGRIIEIKRTDAVIESSDNIVSENKSNTTSNEIYNDRSNKKDKSTSNKKSHADKDSNKNTWLIKNIRVRIISKKLKEESYLQKGNVLHVSSSGLASVRVDDGCVLEDIKEKYLETVLPSIGGTCIVLSGNYKGYSATLLEKNKVEETSYIQLIDKDKKVSVPMDIIAAII